MGAISGIIGVGVGSLIGLTGSDRGATSGKVFTTFTEGVGSIIGLTGVRGIPASTTFDSTLEAIGSTFKGATGVRGVTGVTGTSKHIHIIIYI